jgi:hypothetical protein
MEHTRRTVTRFCIICLMAFLTSAVVALGAETVSDSPGRMVLSPASSVSPETSRVYEASSNAAPLSGDSPAIVSDFMRYEPYNQFPRDLDLWNLEGKRLIQSPPVVSPDKSAFIYTEILFLPDDRQTIAKLYWVPVMPLPLSPVESMPSKDAQTPAPPPIDYGAYAARFDPRKTTHIRKAVANVGFNKVSRFSFRTLTITDWSASGKRVLFKERSGILHLGLRTTNILVYDQTQGTVTIYPEVQRIIKHYWSQNANLPHMDQLVWDIQPLGWEPNSDEVVLLKAWAYDLQEKKFLGLWRYNVSEERTQLVSLNDDDPAVAANGWLPSPIPPPPEKEKKEKPTLKERLRLPFSYDKAQPANSPKN